MLQHCNRVKQYIMQRQWSSITYEKDHHKKKHKLKKTALSALTCSVSILCSDSSIWPQSEAVDIVIISFVVVTSWNIGAKTLAVSGLLLSISNLFGMTNSIIEIPISQSRLVCPVHQMHENWPMSVIPFGVFTQPLSAEGTMPEKALQNVSWSPICRVSTTLFNARS